MGKKVDLVCECGKLLGRKEEDPKDLAYTYLFCKRCKKEVVFKGTKRV